MTATLRYEKTGRAGVVIFDTDDNLNALSEARFADLEAVLDAAEQDPALGALILTGEGRAFCVGLDLGLLDRAFDDIPYFEATVRRLHRLILRLEALPVPVIAAVNGFARAGGFELALGCDFIIMADEARIGDVHTDVGVLPACSSLKLARRIGEQRAKDVIWTARWLKGQEAVDYGLALKSVPLVQLRAEALALAARFTDKPRAVLESLKRLFREGAGLSPQEGAELELQAFVAYMGGLPYGREGFRAYREGRTPSWRSTDG